jgi:hypothetical protein
MQPYKRAGLHYIAFSGNGDCKHCTCAARAVKNSWSLRLREELGLMPIRLRTIRKDGKVWRVIKEGRLFDPEQLKESASGEAIADR